MVYVSYPEILDLFPQHLDPKRSESASFLIWYLENYYRLDTLEAVDAVCDQNGDKGVDGIYVNDFDNSIDIFQARISQKKLSSVGDTALKEFYGTLSQFTSRTKLENLLKTAGDAEVAKLVARIDLSSKIDSYDIRGIFLSNLDLDSNGEAYLVSTPSIIFIGKSKLASTYISDKRDEPIHAPVVFDVGGFSMSEYIVDAKTKAVIVPIKGALGVRSPASRNRYKKDSD